MSDPAGTRPRRASSRRAPAQSRTPLKSSAPIPELKPEPLPLVEYADGENASAFALMLGGLIEANVSSNPARKADFNAMQGRVGIEVRDIDEAVTLDFRGGRLVVYNGLKAERKITISAEAETVMQLSNLKVGPFGLPVINDDLTREVGMKLLTRRLRIDGIPFQIALLNRLTRVFSVQ